MVVLWPEARSSEADRKVSSSAQTQPVPPWNPCIDATPLKSAPMSLSPYRGNKIRMSGQKEAQCVLRLLFAHCYLVKAVTASGTIDISSSAVLTAYLNAQASTGVQCTYETLNPTSGASEPGLYCKGDGSEGGGTYQLIATYTGTNLTATATLNVP